MVNSSFVSYRFVSNRVTVQALRGLSATTGF